MNKNLFSIHKFLANVFTSGMRELTLNHCVFLYITKTQKKICVSVVTLQCLQKHKNNPA